MHTDELSELTVRDPAAFARNMAKVAEIAARMVSRFAASPDAAGAALRQGENLAPMARTFADLARHYMTRPDLAIQAQLDLWQRQAQLLDSAWRRFLGDDVEPVITPERGDRRFRGKAWEENQLYDFLKQSYLITAKWAQDVVDKTQGVDDRTRHRARFYVEQLANALSPSNFALTNPEVLRATLESSGENLVRGMQNLAEDFDPATGELRIRQTDFEAFEVGRNLAVTPGKVIFQNDLMQLIQYDPSTEKVHARPLMIVPPWINKYYILDLTPEKSFIRWAVAQGFTVFVVSWVNPDRRLAAKTFADYMHEGVLAGAQAVIDATGSKDINAVGYCIGGTLLAATLGYMAETGDKRIHSATFLTTQVDFEEAGDLLVFIDEEQVAALERRMAETGYLEGRNMAATFNTLRSNDLIWTYVVNNYLLGREPLPFDLLYWNADSTRMPAAMHSFYLRECYLENNLSRGRMVLDGVRIDLKKVTLPCYNLCARDDHIAPLRSTFRVGQCLGGKTRLVVAGSGHVAGVINPPDLQKYQYWTNDEEPDTLEEWLAGAEEHPGSWWPDWAQWTAKRSGRKVAARWPGDGKLKPIEDAPGSYVREQAR